MAIQKRIERLERTIRRELPVPPRPNLTSEEIDVLCFAELARGSESILRGVAHAAADARLGQLILHYRMTRRKWDTKADRRLGRKVTTDVLLSLMSYPALKMLEAACTRRRGVRAGT
jgi:hypothetical protein